MTEPVSIGGRGVRAACILGFLLLVFSSSASTLAQDGTPQPAGGTSGLEEMLAHVPAELPELDDPEGLYIAYADIAAQLDAVGVDPPASFEDEGFREWSRATVGMWLPSIPSLWFQEFRADYGFDLLQAEQTLEISQPPFNLSLYRGDFDEAAVLAALEEIGYRPGGVDDRRVLSLGDEISFEGPGRYTLGAMSYMTILDDGTLAFAAQRSTIEAIIAVENGEVPSMVEDDSVAALLSNAPSDLVTAVLAPGTMLMADPLTGFLRTALEATPDLDAMATEQAVTAQMPQVYLALLGETAGGPLMPIGEGTPEPLPDDVPTARGVVVLLMQGPAAAEEAVPVIEERLATGATASDQQPFAELFPDPTVTAVPEEAVVVVELPFGETARGILRTLFNSRDLGFVAWG